MVFMSSGQIHSCCFLLPAADEEPFLIFANRYYLRKLNLDGSNYTLLKQVGLAFSFNSQL